MVRRSRTQGFTLLEVLVALVILGLISAAMSQVFSGSLRVSRLSTDDQMAIGIARSRLATASVGVTSGKTSEGFRWTTEVVPYSEADQPDDPVTTFRSYRANVTVAWGDGRNRRSLSLSTLRVEPVR